MRTMINAAPVGLPYTRTPRPGAEHSAPLPWDEQMVLSQYVAIFEWAHNLKRMTTALLRAMMLPYTPEPT